MGQSLRVHSEFESFRRELLTTVDARFAETSRGLSPWPDPHPDRSPTDEEYSRLTDPGRWRILGARAEAWLTTLAEAGLAVIERDADVTWERPPSTTITRTDRAVPHTPGALSLVIARSRIGDVPDAGLTLGAGEPAFCLAEVPDCGCDACDSGSANELDNLDQQILPIVTGTFRGLTAGDMVITVTADSWSATNLPGDRQVAAILADPTGWTDLTCAPWRGL